MTAFAFPIAWDSVEPEKGGALNWSSVDPLVAGAATAGIDVLPFIYGAPSWVVANVPVPGSGGSVKAPKFLPVKTGAQRSAWSAFLAQAVARYGSNGSFWAENPAVPKRPIRIWQIWNEANFKYFVVRPNPADFGKLVNISYAALRRADPRAKIVLSGLFSRAERGDLQEQAPAGLFRG